MRLDATTLTDKICNFKHTERNKTRYQVKKQILTALKTSKIKTKQNNSKVFCFPKTCSFPRTCSFPLLYILCIQCEQKFHENANMFSHFMKLFRLIGPKVSRFAAKFHEVNSVNLGC
jgi:hypothetical protein